jgi:hypothetical protein
MATMPRLLADEGARDVPSSQTPKISNPALTIDPMTNAGSQPQNVIPVFRQDHGESRTGWKKI